MRISFDFIECVSLNEQTTFSNLMHGNRFKTLYINALDSTWVSVHVCFVANNQRLCTHFVLSSTVFSMYQRMIFIGETIFQILMIVSTIKYDDFSKSLFNEIFFIELKNSSVTLVEYPLFGFELYLLV